MDADERDIFQFLKTWGGKFVGATEIARRAGNKTRFYKEPDWAKPALIVLGLWGAGGATIIYLAGLQDIPAQLYEAASIDGANTLQKTWRITLPLLTPSILFNVVMGLIGTFQYFTQAYVAGTFGGPLNSLLFYNLYLYQNAFGYYRMGYASALAWFLLVLVLGITLAIFRTTGRWVNYGR